MNTERLLQYARYDLTINRAFYRNISIVSLATLLSITLLGFLFRWLMADPFSPHSTTGTALMLAAAAGSIHVLYAGCIHHPLRNKQSRISSLTLPATNGEKFLWHVLLVTVGGLLLLLAGILLSDLVNLLLSLFAGFSHIESLTEGVLSLYAGRFPDFDPFYQLNEIPIRGIDAIVVAELVLHLWSIAAFMLGNSIKWRHNIVWTLIALWLLNVIFTFLLVGGAAFIVDNRLQVKSFYFSIGEEAFKQWLWAGYWIFIALTLLTGAWMVWKSWRLYCNAQLTNRLNR